MSGKPYPEGVKRVIDLAIELERLDKEIDEGMRAAIRLKEAREAHAKAAQDLTALLNSMDLTATANAGHHQRLAWFVLELRRQVMP